MRTISRIFRVDRREINYIRSTVESYDGMAVVSTIDPDMAYIEIHIAPGCEDLVSELLNSLSHEEGLEIAEGPKGNI